MDEDVRGLHAAEPREVLGVTVSPHRPKKRASTLVRWGDALADWWLRRRAHDVSDDQLMALLRSLPDVLQARAGRQWLSLRQGGFGRGTGYHAEMRRDPNSDSDEMEIVHVTEPHWTIAWDYKWQYRIVRDDERTQRPSPYFVVTRRDAGEAIPSTPSTSSPRTAKQTQKES